MKPEHWWFFYSLTGLLVACAVLIWCWAASHGLLVLGLFSSETPWWKMPSLFSLPPSLSFYSNGRPLLSRSRRLSFPSSRSPSADFSLCRRRTPASVPTLASQTVSMARRHAVGRRRWTSTATRCTSATIPTRRYRLHGGWSAVSLLWWFVGMPGGGGWRGRALRLICGDFLPVLQDVNVSSTLIRQCCNTTAWERLLLLENG